VSVCSWEREPIHRGCGGGNAEAAPLKSGGGFSGCGVDDSRIARI
jgi:hypothetical protein